MLFKTLAATTAFLCSVAAAAQTDDGMVTAKKPAGIVISMLNAGYDAELTTDDVGDPLINSQVAGYPLQIFFYDCDEETHTVRGKPLPYGENCNKISARIQPCARKIGSR